MCVCVRVASTCAAAAAAFPHTLFRWPGLFCISSYTYSLLLLFASSAVVGVALVVVALFVCTPRVPWNTL